DEDEGEQTQPEGVRIETGLVAAQDAAGLELAQALEHRRGRHVDLAGDLSVGHTSILLNDLQYLCICVIDCSAKHDFHRIMPHCRCVKRGVTTHRAGLRGVSSDCAGLRGVSSDRAGLRGVAVTTSTGV